MQAIKNNELFRRYSSVNYIVEVMCSTNTRPRAIQLWRLIAGVYTVLVKFARKEKHRLDTGGDGTNNLFLGATDCSSSEFNQPKSIGHNQVVTEIASKRFSMQAWQADVVFYLGATLPTPS